MFLIFSHYGDNFPLLVYIKTCLLNIKRIDVSIYCQDKTLAKLSNLTFSVLTNFLGTNKQDSKGKGTME